MSVAWDYIAKIVSLGDSGCGKSSLTVRLCEDRFIANHDITIGVEFASRIVPVGLPASESLTTNLPPINSSIPPSSDQQKFMKLSIWDTAGQETYKSITRSYFRGASGALLVFDITRRQTFDAAINWLSDLRQIAEENIVVVLVGNKCDLVDSSNKSMAENDPTHLPGPSNQVSAAEANEWCRENGVFRYVETSAKVGQGVELAFRELAERIYCNIQAGKYDVNDRRSGVKRAGARNSANTNNSVWLRMNDATAVGLGRDQGRCCW